MADLHNLNLVGHCSCDYFISFFQCDRLKDLLAALIIYRKIDRNLGQKFFNTSRLHDLCYLVLGKAITFCRILLEQLPETSHHGFNHGRIVFSFIFRFKNSDLCFQKRLFLFQGEKFCSVIALNKDSENVLW